MKLTMTFAFDDHARRTFAIARKCEMTHSGLATRETLRSEYTALTNAHWHDIQSDAESILAHAIEQIDNGQPNDFTLIVQACEAVFDKCPDADLYGGSVLDLCADNLPVPLDTLMRAIAASNILMRANARIRAQIVGYAAKVKR